MAQAALSSRSVGELQQLVFTRKVTASALYNDGEYTDWVLDLNLRCELVHYEPGTQIGHAELTFVPTNNSEQPIEYILDRYSTDDQVKVVTLPYEDDLAGNYTDAPGTTQFIGRLTRPTIKLDRVDGQEQEIVTFVAQCIAHLDNEATHHQIFGRWVIDDDDVMHVIESFAVPATFNFNSARNRSKRKISANIAPGPNSGQSADSFFEFHPFTHDDDPEGEAHTVGSALLSVFGAWLFGVNDYEGRPVNKQRWTSIEEATLTALKSPETAAESSGGRWIGLADQLPEITVHGDGCYDAIAAICEATGFQFAIVPDYDNTTDRPYMCRIWRKNSGEQKTVRLARRGSTYADAESTLQANNVNQLHLMHDATEIVNECYVHAPIDIEERFELKPIWSPTDMSEDELSAALQASIDAANTSTYHARHVVGGADYALYGHIGRKWGIDCVGGFAGYSEAPYQHDADGFDFVGTLGLADFFANDPGRPDLSRPIHWVKRHRQIKPLVHPAAVQRGLDYALEVSENSGASWTYCPIEFAPLPKWFGIRLQVGNLANVNLASLFSNAQPEVEDSWWAKIVDGSLRFRITCSIESDTAWRWNAYRQDSSASKYYFGRVVLRDDMKRVLRGPNHFFADEDPIGSGQWADYWPDANLTYNEKLNTIRTVAERMRDAGEDGVWTGTINSWIVDATSYQLGDQITGIEGRDVKFAVNSGSDVRYPNVVGITLILSPGAQQLQLTTDDQRLAVRR